MKSIGVLTSGGDSAGMNPCIRAVVRYAIYNNLKVYGIYRGYKGLVNGEIFEMDVSSVGGIINRGGTILYTARLPEFKNIEVRKKAVENLGKFGIDALVVIGGDGSFRGAHELYKDFGVRVIGVPGTIDNDIKGTDYTIGYDTAINVAMEALDKIRDTATSHERLFIVEVMGRDAGYIASAVGLASGAEDVLVPEVKKNIEDTIDRIITGRKRGKTSSIIVMSEGFRGSMNILQLAGYIEGKTGFETRVTILGHLQRGGSPTALDRIYASRMGAYAVELLLKGETDKMVGIVSNELVSIPLEEAFEKKKDFDYETHRLIEIFSI
ncbi:MAG: 6-phosphofructokinase [Brevinematales bacterium]|nr:6-phosphofructokinase [Brevinematales bacterium]